MTGGLAVIVPARDEALHLPDVLATMPAQVDRIFVVDDGSRDETASIARLCGDERVRVLQHQSSRGVGAALVSGWRAALIHDPPLDICVVMAGDGQMDPADLPALVAPIRRRECDVVWGDRWSQDRARIPWPRRIGIAVLTHLTRWISGVHSLRDSQCGYVACTTESLRRIDLSELFPRYGYPNDLVLRWSRAGVRIASRPVRAVYGTERSGLRAERDVPRILGILWGGLAARLDSRLSSISGVCCSGGCLLALSGAIVEVWLLELLGGAIAGLSIVWMSRARQVETGRLA